MGNMKVYLAISPSGKRYFGMTGTSIKARWYAHVREARRNLNRRPILNAIRKYGGAAFEIRIVADNMNLEDAKFLEILCIAMGRTQDPRFGYNMSAGGDYDGPTGTKIAWENINATPETRAAYIAKLSAIKRSNDWTDYKKLTAATLAWRKNNPERVREIEARAKAGWRRWEAENPEKMKRMRIFAIQKAHAVIAANPDWFTQRLSAGIRRSFADPARLERHRQMVVQIHANRDPEERKRINAKISAKRLAFNASRTPEQKAAMDAQLAAARKNVDCETRKRNQAIGRDDYWARFREERYLKHVAEHRARQ